MTPTENKPEFQQVLETLQWRLENKLAANRKLSLAGRPSIKGYCQGLEDALAEIQQIQSIALKSCAFVNTPTVQVLESSTDIGHGVTLRSWFTRNGPTVVRSETYQLEDGSVVAYQDTINGQPGLLHMDMAFKALHSEEEDFDIILKYAGVLDPNKILIFYAGR